MYLFNRVCDNYGRNTVENKTCHRPATTEVSRRRNVLSPRRPIAESSHRWIVYRRDAPSPNCPVAETPLLMLVVDPKNPVEKSLYFVFFFLAVDNLTSILGFCFLFISKSKSLVHVGNFITNGFSFDSSLL